MIRGLSHAEYDEMLTQFMKLEEDEKDRFRRIADKAADPRVRSLLLSISSDATRHSEMLRIIRNEEYFGTLGSRISVEPDVIEHLKVHIRKESEVVSFYEKMARDRYVPSLHRVMFAELAADELRHHASMEILISLGQQKKEFGEKIRRFIGPRQSHLANSKLSR